MTVRVDARPRTGSRGVLVAILLLAPLSWAAASTLDNLWFGVSMFVGLAWLMVSFASSPTFSRRWSPLRLFVPSLFLYVTCSMSLSQTPTKPIELLCNALAVGGFILGYFIAHPRPTAQETSSNVTETSGRAPLLVGMFFAAACDFVFLVARAGTAPVFATDTNLARTEFFPNGVHSTIVVVFLQVCMMAVACGWLIRAPWARRPAMIVILVASALMLASLGNRGMLALPLLMIVVFSMWTRRLNLPLIVIGAIVALIGFSYSGFQRNLQAWGLGYLNDLALAGYRDGTQVFAPTLSYVAGTSETFSRTIQLIPSTIDFQLGLQFFGPLLLQPSTDIFIKEAAGLDFVGFGLAIGFTNAFYVDWGVIGCFVGPVIFAVLMAYIYRRVDDGTLAGRALLAYVTSSLLLTLYGHPFAYLSYILIPAALFLSLGGSRSSFFPASHARSQSMTNGQLRRSSRHDASYVSRPATIEK